MKHMGKLLLAVCTVCLLFLAASGPTFGQEWQREQRQELMKQYDSLKNQVEGLRAVIEKLQAEKASISMIEKLQAEKASMLREAELAREKVQEALKAYPSLLREAAKEGAGEKGMEADTRLQKALSQLDRLEFQKAQEEDSSAALLERMLSGAGGDASQNAAKAYLVLKGKELENRLLAHGDVGLVALLRFEKAKVCRKSGMFDEAVQELKKIIEQNLAEEITNAARWTLIEVLQEQGETDTALAELEQIVLAGTNQDIRRKKDALYGIINLSGEDPETKLRTIDRLIERLEGEIGRTPFILGPAGVPGASVPIAPGGMMPGILPSPGAPFSTPAPVPPVVPAPESGVAVPPSEEVPVSLPPTGIMPTPPSGTAPVPLPAPEKAPAPAPAPSAPTKP